MVEWLESLSAEVGRRVRSRIDRMSLGNFGDHKGVGEGVQERRLDFGPGYRVYFAEEGEAVVLLLCGGSKSSQRKDINQARSYWQDYQARKAAAS